MGIVSAKGTILFVLRMITLFSNIEACVKWEITLTGKRTHKWHFLDGCIAQHFIWSDPELDDLGMLREWIKHWYTMA